MRTLDQESGSTKPRYGFLDPYVNISGRPIVPRYGFRQSKLSQIKITQLNQLSHPPNKHLTGSTTGPTSFQSLGRTPPMSQRWLSSIVSNQGDVQIILLHNSFLQISNAYKRGKMRYWTPIQNGAVIKLTDCIFWARWPVCSDCIWTQFKIWWAPSKGFK